MKIGKIFPIGLLANLSFLDHASPTHANSEHIRGLERIYWSTLQRAIDGTLYEFPNDETAQQWID